nr:unnamed protein product [Callosobruchus chinensis]
MVFCRCVFGKLLHFVQEEIARKITELKNI